MRKLWLALLLGLCSLPLHAQTVNTRPVTQAQLLANAVSCTGTPQTFLINNNAQSFHYVTYFTSGTPSSLTLFIQGTSDGTHFFQISDTATDPMSGQITAYGYFPLVNVSVSCLGGTSPTVTINYSGTPQSASQSFTQLDSGIYQKVIAQAASTGTSTTVTLLTPYGSSAGWLVAQATVGGFGAGGTLTVNYSDQCNNTSFISNVALAGPFTLTNSAVPQAFAVPPFPTCGVQIVYTHGAGFSGTYSAEYNFSKPGAALVPNQVRHITTAATISVKSGPGSLHSIVVNTPAAGETITVLDIASAACTGTPTTNTRALVTLSATSDVPLVLLYDMQISLGVCIITSSTADLSVMFD